MPPVDLDVIIIGAGLSGLVAAHALQRRGHRVAVIEASDRAGGVIGTRERDGFRYETGPNSALDNTPLLGRLLDELGIAGERINVDAKSAKRFIVRDGRLRSLPMSPPSLLASRSFSTMAKLRLLREPFIRAAPAEREESVAEFARRRLGQEWLDYAVDPFVSGIHAGDPSELSLRAAFPRLHALEQQHGSLIRGQLATVSGKRASGASTPTAARSFSFRNGMKTLTDALAKSPGTLVLNAPVARIVRVEGGGFEVRGTRATSVVVATAAPSSSLLLQRLAPAAARELAALVHAPVAIVASAYRRADVGHPLDGFGFLVPSRERRRILGTLFSSSMFANRAPDGHVLLTTFAGGRRNEAIASLGDAALADVVSDELSALLDARPPQWSEIVRWPSAIPQYTPGHEARIAAIDRATASVPGLFTCASWRDGISASDRVRAGYATAETVARFVSARSTSPSARPRPPR